MVKAAWSQQQTKGGLTSYKASSYLVYTVYQVELNLNHSLVAIAIFAHRHLSCEMH